MLSPWRLLAFLLFPLLLSGAEVPTLPYGENPVAGAYAELNGIRLYYEQYGMGEPALLVIHGNGGSLSQMEFQITYFARAHHVIAVDTRGHGKSGLGAGRLTYVQQADDLAALLDRLHLKGVNVIGWSDGGIIGLLLSLRHPDKVAKLAVTGANIFPDSVTQEVMAATIRDDEHALAMQAKGDKSQDWSLVHQRTNLMITQPDIKPAELGTITIPVLVMAGDRDLILPEHTLLIYRSLKRGRLAIFPNAEHSVCRDQPELFNATVARFFAEP
jgi:pimeloyl-ACP methyl ester carboxylesterase